MQHKIISIIGAGNVGYRLALALYGYGYQIHQVYSRDSAKAKELADKVNAQAISEWGSIDTLAEVYILCLADNALQEAAKHLVLNDKIVCHTAGSVEVDLLYPITQMAGILYPLQSINKNRELDWKTVPFLIESADADTLNTIEDIAKQFSTSIHIVNLEQRRKAHLAAVFANNFTNHLWTIAEQLCNESAVSFDWLKPLITETVSKAMNTDPALAQTGPAIRGDALTIEKHRAMLQNHPQWLEIYNDISKSIKNI